MRSIEHSHRQLAESTLCRQRRRFRPVEARVKRFQKTFFNRDVPDSTSFCNSSLAIRLLHRLGSLMADQFRKWVV
jgi:hypothetical protein